MFTVCAVSTSDLSQAGELAAHVLCPIHAQVGSVQLIKFPYLVVYCLNQCDIY